MQFAQLLFRHKEQRFRTHELEVALVEDIDEIIRLRLHQCPEPLHELAVLLQPVALDDDHQIILMRELLFVLDEVPVVLLIPTHQVIAFGAETEAKHGVEDGQRKEHNHRPHEPLRMVIDHIRQPVQQAFSP